MMAQVKRSIIADQLDRFRRESEERVAERRALNAGLPYLNLNTATVRTEALGLISETEARAARVAVIEKREKGEEGSKGEVALAVFDPQSPSTLGIIQKLKNQGFIVNVFVGSITGLNRVWGYYQFVVKSKEAITGRVSFEGGPEKLNALEKKLVNLSVVRSFVKKTSAVADLLEIILVGAIANRASDIHIEPQENKVFIRNRIDGILYVVEDNFERERYSSLMNRIKLLSNLKLNIKNEPQDGRFSITLSERDIEVRVSVVPSEFGETAVLRLLDPASIQVDLNNLGLRDDDLKIIKNNLALPNGMVINTGPTGSGKTTTLYAFLRSVANPETKVITIEDPIEYRLQWVEQTQVDKGNYTFASGLRSILRQDPDIILIGEIRDLETADIAIQASLTGHLVFSTLHTNDASGAIPRLINLGINTAVLGPALNLIIAQRLVRKLCDFCKKEVKIDKELASKVKKFLAALPSGAAAGISTPHIYAANKEGCDNCGGLGYKGRIAIFELLKVTKEIHELIDRKASITAFEELARNQGMVTLDKDGYIKVLKGITTFEEVKKVTGVDF